MMRKMMRIMIGAVVVFLSVNAFAATDIWTSRLYKIGSAEGTPLYTQETVIETTTDGSVNWSAKIKDAQGVVVMTEVATIKNNRITHQFIEQLQIGESYELNAVEDKATFLTYRPKNGTRGEPTEKETVDVGTEFITGPMTEGYIGRNWEALVAGRKLKVQFGVFELSRTVEFTFQKTGETDAVIKVDMKPASLFISMLVSTMKIEFSKSNRRMIKFTGRTPLRVPGKPKDAFDSEILYQ